MYHPYFRGKQFELITIRESAELLAKSKFVPVIEPVKEALSGLQRALTAIFDANGKAIVVVNPFHGDHSEDGIGITAMLQDQYLDKAGISAGILLREDVSLEAAIERYQAHKRHNPTFVHAGFGDPKGLAEALGADLPHSRHIFNEAYGGKLYRKHFKGGHRVLLRDGFRRQKKNADYPPVEDFSDLHVTYEEEGMDGFGDFLIVGDDFLEGGGPAYAVTIHLTFIDPEKDDAMYIYHFVSTTQNTPTDPAGKFGQALGKLIKKINEPNSKVYESQAIGEFRELHAKGHFPGLAQVKKLSMKHHIETLAHYFDH
jgi:hypothetical protein